MGAGDKRVVREGPFKDFIADGVRTGDLIYLSGQVSVDDEGAVVHAGDLVSQTRQAYAHVRSILEAFGASMSDIVDEMYLVTDMEAAMGNIEALFQARAEAYGTNPDVTQTMVQVAGLVYPELLIEIKCVARAPGS